MKSLRDPLKKMSKSDPDLRSCIYVSDSPDVVVNKFKKAVTDTVNGVSFEPEARPALANLIAIECGLTGKTPAQVCEETAAMQSGQYKMRLAEVVNEHLRPIREKILYYGDHRDHLESTLDKGAEKARYMAGETMDAVRNLVGFTK
jgi:tryptophanyl-tRNA synthetase